jgi:prophage maintenance system killer protein
MTRQLSNQTQQTPTTSPLSSGILQRKCVSYGQHTIAGGESAECQKKQTLLQRRATNESEPEAIPLIVHEVLNSSGQPLAPETRTFMESRFQQDFSKVRVHTDAKAAESAQEVNAIAYTVGQDVVFDAGQYAPNTFRGRQLLGHELTHVLQQQTASPLSAELAISRSTDAAEQQADAVSSTILSGQPLQPITSSPTRIQREDATAPVAVNPEIANVPGERFVDAYTSVHYSLDYRAVGGNLSTWLQVFYNDGTTIDISIYDIRENERVDFPTHLQMMAQGRLGTGGRIFPQVMNQTTTPRLAAAKRSAIQTMEEYNYEFMVAALPAVIFIITAGIGGSGLPAAPIRTTVRLPAIRRTPPPATGGTAPAHPTTAPPRPTTAPPQPAAGTRAAVVAGGGFSRGGITVEEIVAINRRFGGTNAITGHPSSAIAAAERQTGFWKKVAGIVREIAGRHMFNDGNKRTAEEVVRILVERNGITTGVTGAELRRVIHQVATGTLREIDEIAIALRGF